MPIIQQLRKFNFSSGQKLSIFESICDWERLAYGEGRHRIASDFAACVDVEDSGFYVAFYDGLLIGYIDIWQLTKDFYTGLRGSLIVEEDLNASVIVSSRDKPTNMWYVGSMVIEEKFRKTNRIKAAFAYQRLCACVPDFLSTKTFPAAILGVGSSKLGQNILLKWQFVPVAPHPNAVDTPDRPRFEKLLTQYDGPEAYTLRKRATDPAG